MYVCPVVDPTEPQPGLGRSLVVHDPQSKMFPAKGVLFSADAPIKTKTWRRPRAWDQGTTSHCVAFSVKGVCWTQPVSSKLQMDQRKAINTTEIYQWAQRNDPWEGEEPAYYGTSTLSGFKAIHHKGLIPGYRWCFGITEVLQTISNYGPVVVGIEWYDSMFNPGTNGLLTVDLSSRLAGGHAIEVHGVDLRREEVEMTNSWGTVWGNAGRCRLKFRDLDLLLRRDGEAVTVSDTVVSTVQN